MTFRDRPAVRRAGHAALTSTKVPKAFPGFIWTDRPEWGLRMDLRFRVYVSPPLPSSLTLQQQQIMEAVLHKLDASGFRPRGYYAPGLDEGVPSRGGMHELMAMCQGTVVLGFRRGQTSIAGQQGGSVTEYSHIEGGIAIALGKPLLVLREAGMVRRGIVLEGGRRSIVDIAPALPADGLDSIPFFPERYAHWEQQLNQHRHAFLQPVARHRRRSRAPPPRSRRHPHRKPDFRYGRHLLQEIERAASQTICGIFLLTADDQLLQRDTQHAAPCDNVIFEVGYFAAARGKSRTLVVLEEGVKMPADLGGDIYVRLVDRGDPLEY